MAERRRLPAPLYLVVWQTRAISIARVDICR